MNRFYRRKEPGLLEIYNKLNEDIPELKKMLKIARKLKIPIDIT